MQVRFVVDFRPVGLMKYWGLKMWVVAHSRIFGGCGKESYRYLQEVSSGPNFVS